MHILKLNSASCETPKNYSRKNLICSCTCSSCHGYDILDDKIPVKYDVNPTGGHSKPPKTQKGKWKQYWNQTQSYWGEFNSIVEIPELFSQLEHDDFTVVVDYFKRDNVYMPCIKYIVINNIEKYNLIKLKNDRKNKIKNITNM